MSEIRPAGRLAFGLYRKPSGAVAAFPTRRVLADPALTGSQRRADESTQTVYVSQAEYDRLLALATEPRLDPDAVPGIKP